MSTGLTVSKVSETEVSDHLAGDWVRLATGPTCSARSTGWVRWWWTTASQWYTSFLMGDDVSRGTDSSLPVVGTEVPIPFPTSLALPATAREVALFVALRAAACV